MRAARRTGVITIVMLLTIMVSGCSWIHDDEPDVQTGERIAPSLVALFEQYLERDDLSDFERTTLQQARQSGKIRAQDYETAHAKELSCLTDNGYTITTRKLSNGLYQTMTIAPLPASDDEVDRYLDASDRCAQGVSKIIESLYTLQQGNPDLLSDSYEAAVVCLREAGLVDDAFTGDRLEQLINSDISGQELPFEPNLDSAQSCFAGAGLALSID